jgi:hypothetical protein
MRAGSFALLRSKPSAHSAQQALTERNHPTLPAMHISGLAPLPPLVRLATQDLSTN